jgi:L-histidine N-alpha-methyltransferase
MISQQNLLDNGHNNIEYDALYWCKEFSRLWKRSDWLFSLLRSPEEYYKKPIESLSPLIFYLGHLPCFSWAQFRHLNGISDVIDATYDDLFLCDASRHRCIEIVNHNYLNRLSTQDKIDDIDWHSFTVQSVIDYKQKIRAKLTSILMDNTLDLHKTQSLNILNIVAEHEIFHHETLVHLFSQLSIDALRVEAVNDPDLRQRHVAFSLVDNTWVTLHAAQTLLEQLYCDKIMKCSFHWNKEVFSEPTYVSGFELQSHPVRNGDFLHFILDGGYTTSDWWETSVFEWITNCNIHCPVTWTSKDSSYCINFVLQRDVPVESVLDHPVLVSHVEANAYCRWMTKKTGNTIDLPTEAEWVYAMWDYSDCVRHGLASNNCNVNFRHFHTFPVFSDGDDKLQWQGSAFEWTSSVFRPVLDHCTVPSSPLECSTAFVDNRHFLLLGASFATDLRIIHKTLRRWCLDTYRYVFGTFRCVKRISHTDFPLAEDDRKEIVMSLSNAEHRHISSKYLYDAQGHAILARIVELDEYYLFRQELKLLQQRANDIRSIILHHSNIDPHSSSTVHLIELGCGDGGKVEAWLSPWIQTKDKISAVYYPVDISQHAIDLLVYLLKRTMGEDIIEQHVKPVCSTFDNIYMKLNINPTEIHVVMLLGSTIGGFESYGPSNIKYGIDAPVMLFLSQVRRNLKIGDWFICGFDMCKDIMTMIRAYNDSKRVNGAFSRNVFVRINRELNFNFNPANYQHYATYNPLRRQVEGWLISTKQQTVTDHNGFAMELQPYDAINTHVSTKYTREDIRLLMEKNSLRIIEYVDIDNDQLPYTICLAQAIQLQ